MTVKTYVHTGSGMVEAVGEYSWFAPKFVALADFERVREAVAGVCGLVTLLTARSDLRYDRDAILSNHRMTAALELLENING